MSKVRIPVIGTVGKSVRINPGATKGSQVGTDLQLPNGSVPSLAELAQALYVASPPSGTLVIRIEQDSAGGPGGPIFESDIVDGNILARLADNELVTGDWRFQNTIRIIDDGGTDWVDQTHDGADFNFAFVNTLDWNITGITSIQAGTVDADFDALTATSFAGILGGNLTNLAADQPITGAWDFTGTTDFWSATRFGNAGQTDYVTFSHSGVDFNSVFFQTTDWNIGGLTGVVRINDGIEFRVYDAANVDYFEVDSTGAGGVNVTITGNNLNFLGALVQYSFDNDLQVAGDLKIIGGKKLQLFDSLGTDLLSMDHDGADVNFVFTNTLDWNITGITTIQAGTADLDVKAFTAVLIAGIASGNLLDKSAVSEQVNGKWTFIDTLKAQGPGLEVIHSGGVDKIQIQHDGVDVNFTHVNTTDWNITGISGLNVVNYNFDVDQTVGAGQDDFVLTYDNATGLISLEASGGVDDGTETDSILRWSGSAWVEETSMKVTSAGAITALSFAGILGGNLTNLAAAQPITGAWDFTGTTDFWSSTRFGNAGQTDYMRVFHDGVDFNFEGTLTADWNITGITSIQAGTVDADFDAITATSYGGIAEANLLDKTANETIISEYTFSKTAVKTIHLTGVSGPIGIGWEPTSKANTLHVQAVYRTGGEHMRIERVSDSLPMVTFQPSTLGVLFGGLVTAAAGLDLLDNDELRFGLGNDVVFDFNAVDFVTVGSGDWNISGFGSINAATVDLDVKAFTAVLIAGIASGNLLDKSAVSEQVNGKWTFIDTLKAQGPGLEVIHSGGVDKIQIQHDGVDVNFTHVNTTDWNITGISGLNVVNYSFDVDQTVGAGQDDFVLTYDNATGLISLEAASGGGVADGTTTDAVLRWSGSAWVEETSMKVTSAGALTALSFAGILGGNLTNLAAAQPITGAWDFTGTTDFWSSTRFGNAGQTDYMRVFHDGVDFNFEATLTTDWNILSCRVVMPASTTGRSGLNIPEGPAPTSPVDGDVWVETADMFARIDGVSESLLPRGLKIFSAFKPDAQTDTTGTLADDDDLTHSGLKANTVYRWRLVVSIACASTVPDIKWLIGISQTPQFERLTFDYYGQVSIIESGCQSMLQQEILEVPSNATTALVIEGLMLTHATNVSNNFAFRWAQNTANASPLFVQTGSSFIVEEMGPGA